MKKKIICLFMTLVMLVVAFSGCGGSDGDSNSGTVDADTITVKIFDGGYSTSWLTKIAKQYEADTGKKVNIKPPVYSTTGWISEIESGASETDIYFSNESGFTLAKKEGITVNGVKYDTLIADLTDMYNSKVTGEDVLYKDKMISSIRDYANFDYVYDNTTKTYSSKTESGKYYTTYWANGSLSLVVNMDTWQSSWGSFPNTTDELFSLCQTIVDENKSKSTSSKVYPFAYSLKQSYWSYLFETWSYQYMGKNEYNAFINGYDNAGNRFTTELIRYDGFLEAMKCIDECVKARGTNGVESYSTPTSTTSTFTEAQFDLLNGKAVMQPNGNWLMCEMSANYQNAETMNIQFKKVPVVI